MALTRRNTIIGLGALAAGAGVIGGTGAFTAVEADRTMEVDVAGDDNALLQFTGASSIFDDDVEVDTDGGSVEIFQLDASDLNANARTTFADAFTVENTGEQNDIQLMIDEDESDENLIALVDIEDEDGNSIVVDSDSAESESGPDIDDGHDFTVVIDLLGEPDEDAWPEDGNLRFVAAEDPSEYI